MRILSVNSVALTANREVPVGTHNDIVPAFRQELEKAAQEIALRLVKEYGRRDITVEVY